MLVEIDHSEMHAMQQAINLIKKRDKKAKAEIKNIEENEGKATLSYEIKTSLKTTELMRILEQSNIL